MNNAVENQNSSTLLRINDSVYKNKIIERINNIGLKEMLIQAAFNLNVATLLAVLLCGLGLPVENGIQYISFAYLLVFISVIIKKVIVIHFDYLIARLPIFELIDDSIFLLAVPIVIFSGQTMDVILITSFVIASLFITSFFSIKYLINYIIAKVLALVICTYYILLNISNDLSLIYIIFSVVTAYILLISLACWIYVRQIRIHHLNISYMTLYQSVEAKNKNLLNLKNSRDKLIRHIGHDLRQPINAVNYALFNIESSELNKMQGEQLKNAFKSINLINYMIEEILQISIYQDVKSLPIMNESFSLVDLFTELNNEYASIASEHNIKLTVVSCSLVIHSDSKLIARVIRNFLSNAIRHSGSQKLLLGVRRRISGIEIQVLDQGVGISEQLLEKAFDEFVQGESRNGGTGLGLNIAKNIAIRVGGDITIRSELDKGTQCSLLLPR